MAEYQVFNYPKKKKKRIYGRRFILDKEKAKIQMVFKEFFCE